MRPQFPRPLPVVAALTLAVFVGACGDDGSTSAPGTSPSGDVAPRDDSPPADVATTVTSISGSTATDTERVGVTGAVITIGDERFELPNEVVCVALGGAVGGTFTDDSGVQATIDIPPEDWATSATESWEAPSIELRDERDDMNWRIFEAGIDDGLYPGTDAGLAEIQTFAIMDDAVIGSGAVIDTFAILRAAVDGTEPPVPLPLDFEASCS